MPEQTGLIPSVSAGWGYNVIKGFVFENDITDGKIPQDISGESGVSQSWYIGLQWENAFNDGNAVGLAVGQPTFVTHINYDADDDTNNFVADGNFAFELWYMIQISDQLSVTPAVYYLSRPYGDLTDGTKPAFGGGRSNSTFSNLGGLVKTSFKF